MIFLSTSACKTDIGCSDERVKQGATTEFDLEQNTLDDVSGLIDIAS